MKLAAVSDLHWPESKVDLDAIVRDALEARADALVLAGDAVSQYHPERLTHVFRTLRAAAPTCVYVPGNHELWRLEGPTAPLYERHLPALCEQHGWHYLDAAPVIVGDVAIAGNIGWYDYSLTDRTTFADWELAFGAEMFKAARRKPCRTVRVGDVTNELLAWKAAVIVPPADSGHRPHFLRWNDGRFVRLGVSDDAFTQDCVRRLREHLTDASNRAERVVAVTHMVPFAETLPVPTNPVESLMRAYQGSRVLGEVLLEFPKVRLSLFGHRHRPGVHTVGGLTSINVTARPDRGGNTVLRDV